MTKWLCSQNQTLADSFAGSMSSMLPLHHSIFPVVGPGGHTGVVLFQLVTKVVKSSRSQHEGSMPALGS